MKALLAILITACLWVACWIISTLIYFDLFWILVWITSIWAAVDSARIGLNHYKFSTACKPIIVFCLCYIFWIIFFPWYLWARFSIKSGKYALKDENASDLSPNAFKRFFQRWSRRLQPVSEWTLIGIVVLKVAWLVFLVEESWRGPHEWNKYRQELEAKGESLDWNDVIPPPVPDSQNIYSAPMMAEWFVRSRGTNAINQELSKLLANTNTASVTIAKVTIVPPSAPEAAATDFDISLQYSSFGEALFPEKPSASDVPAPPSTATNALPIQFQDVPLDLAIESLVRLKNQKSGSDTNIYTKCVFDTNYFTQQLKQRMPELNIRWERVTAKQALEAVLEAYDLQMIDEPQVGITFIKKREPNFDHAASHPVPFPLAPTNQDYPIVFQDVPATTAIEALARLSGLNYFLDPKIGYDQPDADGRIKPEPVLNVNSRRLTAPQALMAVLNDLGLQLIYNPETQIARIAPKDPDASKIYAPTEIHERLAGLFSEAAGTNIFGSQGVSLFARPLNEVKPVRILLRSETRPTQKELVDFFRDYFLARSANLPATGLVFTPAGTNAYEVKLQPASSAADYLAWSDRFKPTFALIKEAVQRPYSRPPGDYSYPPTVPIPNFLSVRAVAQMLAQRAQCHLLLGQADEALQDLTLLHASCRVLESAPTGKPMPLVSIMINVVVTGLYVDTIADGFRLHAWKEPQLLALQKQLEQINLAPQLNESFHEEELSVTRTFQTVMAPYITKRVPPASLWQRMKNVRPSYVLRGFYYFNIINVVKMDEMIAGSIDLKQKTVSPEKATQFQKAVAALDKERLPLLSPYKLLAIIAVPNYTRALQTFAYDQTRANEAQIACALERYRLAKGKYPDTLNVLVPQYIGQLPHDIIGGQPLKYHPTADGRFVLYSIGWNETDDGGQASPPPYDQGDWVW